jgi:hypothetical protein
MLVILFICGFVLMNKLKERLDEHNKLDNETGNRLCGSAYRYPNSLL